MVGHGWTDAGKVHRTRPHGQRHGRQGAAHGGYPLTVYNRTRERAASLAGHGATVAATPRELAERNDVLITMPADPAAVRAVLTGPDGILAGARARQLLIEMSTVGPAEARDTIERAGGAACR